jgi:hypothetical protein
LEQEIIEQRSTDECGNQSGLEEVFDLFHAYSIKGITSQAARTRQYQGPKHRMPMAREKRIVFIMEWSISVPVGMSSGIQMVDRIGGLLTHTRDRHTATAWLIILLKGLGFEHRTTGLANGLDLLL